MRVPQVVFHTAPGVSGERTQDSCREKPQREPARVPPATFHTAPGMHWKLTKATGKAHAGPLQRKATKETRAGSPGHFTHKAYADSPQEHNAPGAKHHQASLDLARAPFISGSNPPGSGSRLFQIWLQPPGSSSATQIQLPIYPSSPIDLLDSWIYSCVYIHLYHC